MRKVTRAFNNLTSSHRKRKYLYNTSKLAGQVVSFRQRQKEKKTVEKLAIFPSIVIERNTKVFEHKI